MADITKCEGINCQVHEMCYRFTAPSSEYHQAWSDFWKYIQTDKRNGQVCIHFYERK